MTLRRKLIGYLVILHLFLAGAGVYVLMQHRSLLFVVELLFLLSFIVGWRLVRALFVPLELIRTGGELMTERNFGTRFVTVGEPELDGLVRIYNSMTDRLREERLAAQEQQQLLQQIVDASPSGIVICDFDGNVEQMNPSATRLLRGQLMDELFALVPGEARLVAHDGARRVKVWRAEFRDRGFPKTFFLLEEMTEELRLSEKAAYEKLIRMMSHEVNNSVGAVRSLLESLLRYGRDVREDDREDFTNALTIASSRMDALNRFMGDFAEVVRIPQPHRTAVNVATVVRNVVALLRPEAELDLEEVTIDADRAQLEQVVINIVRNAMDAGEPLRITLRPQFLAVADSGTGIADDVRAELFTPFFTTKRDGRGLGLTIVQEILTNHGFAYALENGDGGAVFTIRF
ncbi:MAG TPA: PAS domain-containing sensor histidine kinase [Thermoanaerobaculia bacterium]